MELASTDAMAAWFALPVLHGFSFLFFTGRGGSFLSLKKRKKRMGAKKMRATNGRPYDVYFGAVKNR
ncbi:MAG: hypothetical protein DBX57_00955 [Clostridia bacterium]|nr:MAG: hypothetical protein DBX57_00955 [Clostridia bacterium]